jgi:hypothetical protein
MLVRSAGELQAWEPGKLVVSSRTMLAVLVVNRGTQNCRDCSSFNVAESAEPSPTTCVRKQASSAQAQTQVDPSKIVQDVNKGDPA